MKKGILFIHGIQEKPEIFDPYLPLIPKDWDVERLLLQGHKASLKEFGKASMRIWKKQVQEAVDSMRSTHDVLILAGHSMGTLLAMGQESKADALFLLNTPFTIRITPEFLKISLKKMAHSKTAFDAYEKAALRSWSVYSDGYFWDYIPFCLRYLELFYEIFRERRHAGQISIPVLAFFGWKDEMVSPRSARFFQNKANMETFVLQKSGHFYIPPEEQSFVFAKFKALLSRFESQS